MTTFKKRLCTLLAALAVPACTDSPTAPAAGTWTAPPLMAVVIDPLDPDVQTHTFDDLPENCVFDVAIPNPYEGLTFASTPYFGACVAPNGTIGLVPADQPKYGEITEIFVDLPRPASAVSLDVYDLFTESDPTLNAYDGSGALVSSASDSTDGAWVTLSVSGDIHRLGIATDQGNTYLDDLTITYLPGGGEVADKDACKNGGWQDLGFGNQGLCVQFVETGRDSR